MIEMVFTKLMEIAKKNSASILMVIENTGHPTVLTRIKRMIVFFRKNEAEIPLKTQETGSWDG
jgi:hypothetical protein